ncbi:branched-chain amino acid transport system permease protein [Rhodoligotrophos appendicifer]|uniref:branched-chain amino acid ABC transporter permease n=1 Tax=Rhodoligotrophos appendicifer TaxID=987056 RepID=UPI00117DE75C|nr:branched-chain amino acid ABC transporter permease [Rhodoligotrophos appendicifer]
MSPFLRNIVVAFIVAAAASVLALTGDDGLRYVIALVLVWAIFAIGFDLVFGVSGIISFGHAAFFGTGAYAYAILTLSYGTSTIVALFAAVAVGTIIGLAFAAVTLRQSGIYLALTTLALAQLVHILAEVKLKNLTGGTDGMAGVPRPEFLGIDFYDDGNFAYLVAILFFLLMALNALLRASPFGQVLAAIRQNETRTSQLGYDTRRYKLGAFAISGAYSGLAGALLGCLVMFVGPDMTRWNTSGDVLIMTVLGGRGLFLGPVVGVAVFETLKEGISAYTDRWYGLLGTIFILVTLYMPGGISGMALRLRASMLTRRRLAAPPLPKPGETTP